MPLSMVEKIAQIAKTVPQIAKLGHNSSGDYDFIRAIDMFDAVRIKLFEAGILIFPLAQKSERSNPYVAVTGDITDEVKVEIIYRVTDGKESVDCCAHGVGQDHGGKALYMASTGAKKDLLKTIFLIAGVEDDSESVESTERLNPALSEKIAEMEARCGTDVREWNVGRTEVLAFTSACRSSGFTQKAQKAFLKSCGVEKISDLKRKDFSRAMKWATGQEEMNGEDSSSAESGAAEE